MRFSLLNIYTAVIAALVTLYIATSIQGGILTSFDYVIVVYLLVLEEIDEENLIWFSLVFGLFSDFARNSFYGPSVFLFVMFAFLRFKADIIMDTGKVSSKVIVYFAIAMIYSVFNLYLTGYSGEVLITTSILRSLCTIAVVLVIYFLKGARRVTQDS